MNYAEAEALYLRPETTWLRVVDGPLTGSIVRLWDVEPTEWNGGPWGYVDWGELSTSGGVWPLAILEPATAEEIADGPVKIAHGVITPLPTTPTEPAR